MCRNWKLKIIAFVILFIGLYPNVTRAQTCTGSLGDPIINETFGTDHFELPPYKTSFPYVGGCPTKGTYTINNFLFGCGDAPGAWTKMIGDHTGDPHGNYMLVNAESQPGNVYTDTAKNLCGNTVYQFGMWVTSVMTTYACGGDPALPNLSFEVKTLDGAIIGSGFTGPLPLVEDRQWNFYSILFTNPPGIDNVIVSIKINPAFRCGSGFAIDDITLRPCGPMITAKIDGGDGPEEVCADYTNPFVMTAAFTPGFSDPVLQWQSSVDTGTTWVDIAGENSATYTMPRRASDVVLYRVSIAERVNINSQRCRITSNTIYTNIHPVPMHMPPQDIFGCLGKDYFFPAPDPYSLAVVWTGPGGFSSDQPKALIPDVQYKDTGLYTQLQTLRFGCISLDTFNLKVFPGATVTIQPSHPLCEGQSEQLLASSTDNSVDYKWTPATALSNDAIPNPVASPTGVDSIKYQVLITNKYGCKDSVARVIVVNKNAVADAGPDKTILIGDTATLNGTVKGTKVNYNWSPSAYLSSDHVMSPKASPPSNTIYTLNVTSTVGCGNVSDNVLVKVYKDFFIPGAFTPNGDGKNDIFRVLVLDNYKLNHLLIYNRWGQPVFKSLGSYDGWDGTFNGQPQPAGVYVYTLEMHSPTGEKIEKRGTVLLIR